MRPSAKIQSLSDRDIFKQRLKKRNVFLFNLFYTTAFKKNIYSDGEKRTYSVKLSGLEIRLLGNKVTLWEGN